MRDFRKYSSLVVNCNITGQRGMVVWVCVYIYICIYIYQGEGIANALNCN